jgi:hypothetical protein
MCCGAKQSRCSTYRSAQPCIRTMSMMTEERLLAAIIKRAANAETRTDFAKRRPREVGPRATPEVTAAAEQQLGFALHYLHKRLLEEIGNGGFGPGDGLIGIFGGALDVDDRSIIELRQVLWPNAKFPVVPLCDWGDGIWSCIDCVTGGVVSMSEFRLMDMGQGFQSWIEEWVSGTNLWERMVLLGDSRLQKPRTKEWITVPTVTGMKGNPYVPGIR